jgi:anti-sigma regulatory factor (Ser/Thr protein kinase)
LQSALNAAVLQLGAAKDPSPDLIESVRGDIASALARVGFDSGQSYSFEQAQQEISKIWAGTVETRWQVQPEAQEALCKNPATSECLAEVLREAVSNASKHGKATSIEIAVNIEDSVISMQAKDNGTSPDIGKTQGLGTELLDDVCSSWSREPAPSGGMTLRAKLLLEA